MSREATSSKETGTTATGLFWKRVRAFFSPVPGWKDRVKKYVNGQQVWEVPGKPDKPKLVPFPLEWIPHDLDTSGGDDADEARGFKFVETVCAVTGKELSKTEGVRCARCGIDLDESVANMAHSLDVPSCNWCKPLVRSARR